MAWLGSMQPFMAHPLWQQLAPLPWAEKLARLRDPQVRATLTDLAALRASAQYDTRLAYLTQGFHKMYALGARPDYEPARELWNGMIDKHPALVARCRGEEDVAAAVDFARDHGLPLAVRGGGLLLRGFGVREID